MEKLNTYIKLHIVAITKRRMLNEERTPGNFACVFDFWYNGV